MNVYALGATEDGAVPELYPSLLRAGLSAQLGADGLILHGEAEAAFEPENCAAVLVAGGTLTNNAEAVEPALKYSRAMRWFSESTIGISLGVDGGIQKSAAIDSLKLIATRDAESARLLRQSGVQGAVATCADLDYLQPVMPRRKSALGSRPVLGVLAGEADEGIAETVRGLEPEFEVRFVTVASFADVDVCLTTQRQGVILSTLYRIPFVAIPNRGEALERELQSIGYPEISDVRSAWSERGALLDLIDAARPQRINLARRNIELVQAMLHAAHEKVSMRNGKETLLVWAAPDEYWDEAEEFLAGMDSGFDCLVPANSRVTPPGARKRMAVPAGSLMHWGMFPEELRRQIEQRYDNAVVCHAFRDSKHHLSDIAAKAGRTSQPGLEFRLWTHSCESYS